MCHGKTTFWLGSWPRQWSLKFRTSVVTRYHVKTDGIPWWSCWSWHDVWHNFVFFEGKVYLQFRTRFFPTFRNLICFLDQEVEHSEMMRLVEVVWFGHGCQMTWAFQCISKVWRLEKTAIILMQTLKQTISQKIRAPKTWQRNLSKSELVDFQVPAISCQAIWRLRHPECRFIMFHPCKKKVRNLVGNF